MALVFAVARDPLAPLFLAVDVAPNVRPRRPAFLCSGKQIANDSSEDPSSRPLRRVSAAEEPVANTAPVAELGQLSLAGEQLI